MSLVEFTELSDVTYLLSDVHALSGVWPCVLSK